MKHLILILTTIATIACEEGEKAAAILTEKTPQTEMIEQNPTIKDFTITDGLYSVSQVVVSSQSNHLTISSLDFRFEKPTMNDFSGYFFEIDNSLDHLKFIQKNSYKVIRQHINMDRYDMTYNPHNKSYFIDHFNENMIENYHINNSRALAYQVNTTYTLNEDRTENYLYYQEDFGLISFPVLFTSYNNGTYYNRLFDSQEQSKVPEDTKIKVEMTKLDSNKYKLRFKYNEINDFEEFQRSHVIDFYLEYHNDSSSILNNFYF